MSSGRLITIEGIDGAGKSTLAVGLERSLAERGIDIHLRREPGGVPASERLRQLIKDPDLRIGARAEALVYAAARAQLVEEDIDPLLAAGSWVLLDRFVESSLAYQGGGRELGILSVRAVNEFATGGLQPDRTLLLEVDPAVGRSRSRARSEPPDRLEREADQFFARVGAAYRELQRQDPDRIRPIDGAQPADQVLRQALAELRDLL